MSNSSSPSSNLLCQICGAPAKNKYQNVMCCESCKAFFRRTTSKGTNIRCPFMGNCDVEIGTRKLCRACRLQKCYRAGMGSIKSPIDPCQIPEVPDPCGQPLPMPVDLDHLNQNQTKEEDPHSSCSSTDSAFQTEVMLHKPIPSSPVILNTFPASEAQNALNPIFPAMAPIVPVYDLNAVVPVQPEYLIFLEELFKSYLTYNPSQKKDDITSMNKKVSIRKLWRYATGKDLLLVVVGALIAIMTGSGMPLMSIIVGNISSSFIKMTRRMNDPNSTVCDGCNETFAEFYTEDDFHDEVVKQCKYYAVLGGLVYVAAFVQVSCFLTSGEQMIYKMRLAFFRGLLHQDITWFDENNSGTLTTKLFDNLERVKEGTGDKVGLLIQFTSQFVAGFIIAFTYDWRLTLIMASLSPFLVVSGLFMAKFMESAAASEAVQYSKAGSSAEQALGSIRTVVAFNGQEHECQKYETALNGCKAEGVKKNIYVGVALASTFAIIFASYALSFWVGTGFVANGTLDPKTVLTVFFSVLMGSVALGQAGQQFAVIGTAQGAASAIFEIIDRVPEIDSYSTEGQKPQNIRGRIAVKDLKFAYPTRKEIPVCKEFSFTAEPGQTVALVGSSGIDTVLPNLEDDEKSVTKRLLRDLQVEGGKEEDLLTIIKHARPWWLILMIAVIASVINGIVFPAFRQIFSTPDVHKMKKDGRFWSIMLLLCGVVQGITAFLQSALFGYVSEQLTTKLRSDLFRNVMRMDIGYFDKDNHSSGKISTRLATDTPNVKSAIDYRLGTVIAALISIVCGLIISFYYSWAMALLVIGVFPLGIIGRVLQLRYLKGSTEKDARDMESAGNIALQGIENVRTVQALTLEKKFYDMFEECLVGPHKSAKKDALIQGVTYGFSTSILYFIFSGSFRFALWLILYQSTEPMYVMKVLMAISFSMGNIGFAAAYFPEYKKARLAAGIIFKMLGEVPEIDSFSDEGSKEEISGNVHFKQLWFSYPQRKDVQILKGLDISVKPGQTLALVGPSGCGKSTCISLLERFYDPLNGTVEIDGIDLKKRNIRHARSSIALVSQEPILFDCSIKENLLYGLDPRTVSDEQIVQAATLILAFAMAEEEFNFDLVSGEYDDDNNSTGGDPTTTGGSSTPAPDTTPSGSLTNSPVLFALIPAIVAAIYH
ncbi:hypothetical protein FO519_001901 [Halicephalobus sp. NKZ332]|nr:hypothetical protein FO519_001901 [Halicephalobus sp. NKZ332]